MNNQEIQKIEAAYAAALEMLPHSAIRATQVAVRILSIIISTGDVEEVRRLLGSYNLPRYRSRNGVAPWAAFVDAVQEWIFAKLGEEDPEVLSLAHLICWGETPYIGYDPASTSWRSGDSRIKMLRNGYIHVFDADSIRPLDYVEAVSLARELLPTFSGED